MTKGKNFGFVAAIYKHFAELYMIMKHMFHYVLVVFMNSEPINRPWLILCVCKYEHAICGLLLIDRLVI